MCRPPTWEVNAVEGDQKSPSLHSLYGNELMKNAIININFKISIILILYGNDI
jgi:hypothetical protein